MSINIIACIDRNRAIGYKSQLLFHIPEDMKRFRELTTGYTIVMGRKTFESLPNGALPHRRNIVISHTAAPIEGCEVFHSIEEALSTYKDETIFIIGGAEIYKQTLPIANKIYLTEVDDTAKNADAYFPEINEKQWKVLQETKHQQYTDSKGIKISYTFKVLERNIL